MMSGMVRIIRGQLWDGQMGLIRGIFSPRSRANGKRWLNISFISDFSRHRLARW